VHITSDELSSVKINSLGHQVLTHDLGKQGAHDDVDKVGFKY